MTRREQLSKYLVWASILFPALAIAAAYLLWPGDSPFINDEPRLITMALDANQRGSLATESLVSNRGLVYGPVAVWLYQAVLKVTTNLPLIVAGKAALFLISLGLFVAWVVRRLGGHALRLPGIVVMVAALGSPFVWFYARHLWDNVFLLPLGALFAALLVKYLQRPRGWLLPLSGVLAAALINIHPMSVVLIAAAGVVCLLRILVSQRKQLIYLTTWGLFVVAGMVPLLRQIYSSTWAPSSPPPLTALTVYFPLLAPRYFSQWGMDYFLDAHWAERLPGLWGVVVRFADSMSLLALPLGWAGLLGAGWIVLKQRRRRPLIFWLAVTALLMFLAHWFLAVKMRLDCHPHYYNGVFLAWLFFLGLTVHGLAADFVGRWILRLYAAGMVVGLLGIVSLVHGQSGNKTSMYGPTLGNQIQMVRELSEFSPQAEVVLEADNWREFPHERETLTRIYGSPAAATPVRTSNGRIVVEWADRDGYSGRMKIR